MPQFRGVEPSGLGCTSLRYVDVPSPVRAAAPAIDSNVPRLTS